MAKAAVVLVWLLGAGSLLLPAGSASAQAGGWLLAILALAHALECVAFLPKLRRAGGSLPRHLLRTFVFGMLHVRELERPA